MFISAIYVNKRELFRETNNNMGRVVPKFLGRVGTWGEMSCKLCAHITTSIKFYLVSLRYVQVALTFYFMPIKLACIYFNLFSKCKQTFNIT